MALPHVLDRYEFRQNGKYGEIFKILHEYFKQYLQQNYKKHTNANRDFQYSIHVFKSKFIFVLGQLYYI